MQNLIKVSSVFFVRQIFVCGARTKEIGDLFDQNVYGKQVNVMFIKHIRSEKKFPSINDLIEQLNKDKQQIINEMI